MIIIILLFIFILVTILSNKENFNDGSKEKNIQELRKILLELISNIDTFKKKINKFSQKIKSENILQENIFPETTEEKKEPFVGTIVKSIFEMSADKCEWGKRDLDKNFTKIKRISNNMLTTPISALTSPGSIISLIQALNFNLFLFSRNALVCILPNSIGIIPVSGLVYEFTNFIRKTLVNLIQFQEKIFMVSFHDTDTSIHKPLPCDLDTDCLGFMSGERCCRGFCHKGACRPSEIGEKCKVATDCKGWGPPKATVCCNPNGKDKNALNLREWGVCTKPCINTGIGWCPTTAKNRKIKCEKALGEACNIDTDCSGWGWGVGGKGIKCCSGKCSVYNQGKIGNKCSNKSDCCGRDCKPPYQDCTFGKWVGKVGGVDKICCKYGGCYDGGCSGFGKDSRGRRITTAGGYKANKKDCVFADKANKHKSANVCW